jgi:hypothetical protein
VSKRITKLTSVQTQEVSLVRRGANNKRFALTKSKEIDMSFHELLKSVLETEAEGEGQLIESLKAAEADEDAIQCAVANYRLQNGFRDKLSKEAFAEVVKAAGYEMDKAKTSPDKDKDKAKDKGKEPFPGAKPPFKAKSEKSDMSPEMERVFKEQQEELATLRKDHDDLLAKTEKENKERIRKEYIAKCANDYSFVPGMSAEEMGEMLQKAYETSDDFGKKLEKQWEQTNEAVSKSQLLVNQGIVPQNDGQCATAWTKMNELAKQKIQKAEGGLSEAQALDQVMKEHPELYQEYLSENPAQTGDSE